MITIIEIVIAVIVVYLIFSVIVYVIVELISSWLELRGKTLRNAIFRMLSDEDARLAGNFGKLLYEHPQITRLKKNTKLPSYIPANNVAVALIDIIKNQPSGENAFADNIPVFDRFRGQVARLPQGELQTFLQSITDHTASLSGLTTALEEWYNSYMDRVTGWYKKNIRIVVLIVGAFITVGFNVDSIHLVKVSATDRAVRERMNRFADVLIRDSMTVRLVEQQRIDPDYNEEYVDDSSMTSVDTTFPEPADMAGAGMEGKLEELRRLNQMITEWDLPVGWKIKQTHDLPLIIVGWILTIAALCMGAPFWFDLLKKLVNIRSAGIKPDVQRDSNKRD